VKAAWKDGEGGERGSRADQSEAVGAHQSSSLEGRGRETSERGIEVGMSSSIWSWMRKQKLT
jgi:hypothetical protein